MKIDSRKIVHLMVFLVALLATLEVIKFLIRGTRMDSELMGLLGAPMLAALIVGGADLIWVLATTKRNEKSHEQ